MNTSTTPPAARRTLAWRGVIALGCLTAGGLFWRRFDDAAWWVAIALLGVAAVLLGLAAQALRTSPVKSPDPSTVEVRPRLVLERRRLSVRGLTLEVVHLLQPRADAKDLALEANVESGVPDWILGDPERLRQLLIRLVEMGIKFTAAGGVTIDVSADPQNAKQVLFTVTDSGVGMPAAPRAPGRALSTAGQLAESMGGVLTVTSTAGRGTNVTLALPFEACGAADLGRTALIVEDNATNQLVLVRLLQRLGVSAEIAANGADALVMLQRQPFDLVLMDMQMPVMDGVEATTRIRAGEAGLERATVPIIAMTADSTAEARQRCLASGMNDHLTKPVKLDALESGLGKWLAAA